MLVLAHRGASRRAPENTLEAFELAITLGADGVELDVRRSADGVLVVVHDAELPGLGLVVEHSFAALRAAVPTLPTLAEALDVVGATALVNVEMKCCAWDADPDPDRVVARGVAAELDARGSHGRVVVSSFDSTMLDDLRALDGRVSTGWLVQGHDPSPDAAVAAARGHQWLHPDWGNLVTHLDAAVAAARSAGVRLDTWTVDDPEVIARLAAAGVDAVITNEPDVARAALR